MKSTMQITVLGAYYHLFLSVAYHDTFIYLNIIIPTQTIMLVNVFWMCFYLVFKMKTRIDLNNF